MEFEVEMLSKKDEIVSERCAFEVELFEWEILRPGHLVRIQATRDLAGNGVEFPINCLSSCCHIIGMQKS